MMKYYDNLSGEEKKKLRTILDNHRKVTKEQIELLEKNLIKPLKDRIKANDDVIHKKISIEQYIHISEAISKHLKGYFGVIANYTTKSVKEVKE